MYAAFQINSKSARHIKKFHTLYRDQNPIIWYSFTAKKSASLKNRMSPVTDQVSEKAL